MSAFELLETAIRIFVLAFCATALNCWATGDEAEHACNGVSCGLQFRGNNNSAVDAPLLRTAVQMDINGTALRTVVKQTFQNTSDEWVEGFYRFPLPDGAAVNELRMKIGEREIIGEIQEREAAEKTYQNAKQTGRKASLLQAHRPNLFTTKVANIGPAEQVDIVIVYFKELPLSTQTQEVRFPMVVGPRYTPRQKNNAEESSLLESRHEGDPDQLPPIPTLLAGSGERNSVSIDIKLNIGVPLTVLRSLYHQVDVEQQDTQYVVRLMDGSVRADRDFVLEFAPQQSLQPSAALLSEQRDGFHYGLLMIMPPSSQATQPLPREVTFILDRSGSMSGTSIVQAKAAVSHALEQLKAGDRFNIVQFNSGNSALFEQAMDFSPTTLSSAQGFVRGLTATGGTEMLGALRRAFNNKGSEDHVQQVIFITDGNVSNETALFNFIEKNLGKRRLFTVGIGSAPNHYFLRHAAKAGSGFHLAIGDLGEVESRMGTMLKKIKTPLLTDITVSIDEGNELVAASDVSDVEIWPRVIPDLYVGEPITIAVRSREPGVKLRLDGKLPDYHWHSVATLAGGQRRGGLAELWGQRKITALMADYRRARTNETEQQALRNQVIQTALNSHLVSKFTSLVAVEKRPSNIDNHLNKTKLVPRHLPHGWSQKNWVTTLPRTGTDAPLRLRIGGLLMLSCIAMLFVTRRQRAVA